MDSKKTSLQVLTKALNTWERQPGETDKSYQAFCVYRDMLPHERSIQAIGRKHKLKNASHHGRWSIKYEWVQRCRAFDNYLDVQARQKREKDHLQNIEAFSERQRLIAAETLKSAVQILKKANSRLAKLKAEDIHSGSLPSYYRAAASLIEAASNSESMALGIEQLLEALQQFKQR
jgi:hypothetical protein